MVVCVHCKLLMYCIIWKDVHHELRRLVELRLLLVELSERISMNLLDMSELPEVDIDQVLHCAYNVAV